LLPLPGWAFTAIGTHQGQGRITGVGRSGMCTRSTIG
jgi:hypothetical protein